MPAGSGGNFLGDFFGGLKSQVEGIIKSFGGLAIAAAVLKPVFEGLMEVVGPVLGALAVPLKIIGQVLGTLIVPVLKLLFPPLKFLGIAVAFVAENIMRAIGKLLEFVGKIPGLGKLKDIGRDMLAGADEIKKTRKELQDMSFEDAMEGAAEAAERFAEALTNVPRVFAINAHRFGIGSAGLSGGLSGNGPTDTGPGGLSPVDPPRFDVHVHLDGQEITRSVEIRTNEKVWRGGTPRLEPAF